MRDIARCHFSKTNNKMESDFKHLYTIRGANLFMKLEINYVGSPF